MSTSSAEDVAEIAEQVREVRYVAHPPARATLRPGAAEICPGAFVVIAPLLRIGEDLVGVLDLLEALLGLCIIPVGVWMVLTGKLL